jgi:hypothetical protein
MKNTLSAHRRVPLDASGHSHGQSLGVCTKSASGRDASSTPLVSPAVCVSFSETAVR